MAKASITIEDNILTAGVTVNADFGNRIEPDSQSHRMIDALLQLVLKTSDSVQEIEDTAGDINQAKGDNNGV